MARWKLLEEGGMLWGYCMELIKYTIPWLKLKERGRELHTVCIVRENAEVLLSNVYNL